MADSLPKPPQQMYSSQLFQQSKYHNQTNEIPHPKRIKYNNWTKVSYKRGRSAQDETETKRKQTLAQPNFHVQWLQSSTGRGK
jgi:hypothetical protein